MKVRNRFVEVVRNRVKRSPPIPAPERKLAPRVLFDGYEFPEPGAIANEFREAQRRRA